MEKYILKLLKENSRVIIPEFGAFIIRQQNPPEIAFNSFLTFNDGILIEYISGNEGIPYQDASLKVSQFSDKLNTELKLHNRLSFNEIGWVWLDDAGEKQFTPWKAAGQPGAETSAPVRDIETILKEAEAAQTSPVEPSTDAQAFQPADQAPFILDDTMKEVDIDATKDSQVNKSIGDSPTDEGIPEESFSLEEAVITGTGNNGKETVSADAGAEILIKPKIDLAETLQEVQKGKSVTETEPEVPKIGIRFRHEMPPEETVIAQDYVASGDADQLASGFQDAQKSSVQESQTGTAMDEQKKPPVEVWKEIESKPVEFSKKVQEKKKRRLVVPVIVAGTIIILAVAAWLIFPEQVNKIIPREKQNQVEISPGIEISDDAESSTSESGYSNEQVTDQEPEQVPDESETISRPETAGVQPESQVPVKKYYIVAGRFKSQQNAERYTDELRSKGFNSEYFSTQDNLFTVSFNSFSSRESAEAEMDRIRKSIEPSAWILYY
jgi:nucleoid DNA-binding protein